MGGTQIVEFFAGFKTAVKLFKRIILKNMREDRFLTVLSVLGVALGIGLFMGVNTATNRAVASFETSTRGIDSAYNYQIVDSSGLDFREDVYRTVKAVAGKALPVLTAGAYLPELEQTVEITGIYTPAAFADLRTSATGDPDMELFFTHPHAVLITKRFSDEYGVRKGDVLPGIIYSNRVRFKIAGVLDLPAAPVNMVLMDLGNYQESFGKTGTLSRIDIIATAQEAGLTAKMLPANLALEKKEQVVRNQQSLVDGFRFNLRFVTFLAVLVGVYLLYNTIFMSVAKRRTEIGILRGLGMGRTTVVALFSAQGALLGFGGSVLGVAFGQLSASLATGLVGRTITRFYGTSAAADSIISPGDALGAVGFGLLVSFLASLAPALESANVRPMESSRAGTFEQAYRGRQKFFSIAGGILILFGTALTLFEYLFIPFAFPWLSYAGILLFILGCTLNAPAYLGAALTVLKRPLKSLFRTAGRVAAGDLRGTRYRFSLALMSVAVSAALVIAISSSVYSLKSSFIDWIDTYLSADLYIKPASCISNFCWSPLPEEVVSTVYQLPGVDRASAYRALRIRFRGRTIVAGFGNSESLWKDRPNISGEEKERLQRLALERAVSVSDYIAVQYRLKKGDVIAVETPKGPVSFVINSTSISYSTMSGFLYFDRRWLKEFWGLDDATQISVYLKKGEDPAAFTERLRKRLGRTYALDITDNSELRRSVLAVFDRSFAITNAIEMIAIVISLIGVVNALLILVLEKKRDIATLRYLGASWGDIRRVMVLSAGVVGASGIVLGAFMGAGISMAITHVINKISFGWEVVFRVPLLTVWLFMALLLVITLLAGLIPAFLARKIDPKAYISFE